MTNEQVKTFSDFLDSLDISASAASEITLQVHLLVSDCEISSRAEGYREGYDVAWNHVCFEQHNLKG